jgi:hypothetical protein
MRRHLLVALALVACAATVRADEAADKVAAQKKQAEANWSAVEAGEFASLETSHLLIYAPKSAEKNLKEIGAVLEKHYAEAARVLGYDAKKAPWVGKITVYLLPEKDQFQAFVRRVEKRRVESGERFSHAVDGDLLHAVAGPSQSKDDFGPEVQAGQQVAAAMMQFKAGAKVPLPDWLLTGFGRATTYRVSPQDKVVLADRKVARDAVPKKKLTAKAVYSAMVDVDELPALSGALAELLAYGPGTGKFTDFLAGFKPEENVERKTTEQALEAAGLKLDRLETAWKAWVSNTK